MATLRGANNQAGKRRELSGKYLKVKASAFVLPGTPAAGGELDAATGVGYMSETAEPVAQPFESATLLRVSDSIGRPTTNVPAADALDRAMAYARAQQAARHFAAEQAAALGRAAVEHANGDLPAHLLKERSKERRQQNAVTLGVAYVAARSAGGIREQRPVMVTADGAKRKPPTRDEMAAEEAARKAGLQAPLF